MDRDYHIPFVTSLPVDQFMDFAALVVGLLDVYFRPQRPQRSKFSHCHLALKFPAAKLIRRYRAGVFSEFGSMVVEKGFSPTLPSAAGSMLNDVFDVLAFAFWSALSAINLKKDFWLVRPPVCSFHLGIKRLKKASRLLVASEDFCYFAYILIEGNFSSANSAQLSLT